MFACELSRLDVYSESLLGAARQIRTDPVHQKESCHLLPFQDKFLTTTQGNRLKLDNYSQNLAQLPNFIERKAQVCARLSSKLESSTSLSNVSTVSRSSDISRGLVYQPIAQVLAASSRSLVQKTESNKAPIVIPISEVGYKYIILCDYMSSTNAYADSQHGIYEGSRYRYPNKFKKGFGRYW